MLQFHLAIERLPSSETETWAGKTTLSESSKMAVKHQ